MFGTSILTFNGYSYPPSHSPVTICNITFVCIRGIPRYIVDGQLVPYRPDFYK